MKVLTPNLQLKIRGTGRALPESPPVSNEDLMALFPENRGKNPKILSVMSGQIQSTYGFRERHMIRKPGEPVTEGTESSESLAARASEAAVPPAQRADLQACLMGTTTSRRYTGSVAAHVTGRLGAVVPSYEMKAGCSTSIASLHLASTLLASYSNVLVTCAESLTKVIHPDHKENWFGLADGGAALWLENSPSEAEWNLARSTFQTDGRHVDLYTTPLSLPPSAESLAAGGYYLTGDILKMKDLARERYLEMIETLLPSAADRKSITHVVPHAANKMLTEEVLQATGLAPEVVWTADRFGNLGGSSVLFGFVTALEERRFPKGSRVLMMSVGGGLSFAAQIWEKI